MRNIINWSEWILQKNAEAKVEELKKSDFVEVENMQKTADTKLRNAVKAANQKLNSAGIKGGYGVTTNNTPHWDYEYDDKHSATVEDAHNHITPHLPDGHTHEDYEIGAGKRHTYGGDPDHVNLTAQEHPKGMLSVGKKINKSESVEVNSLEKNKANKNPMHAVPNTPLHVQYAGLHNKGDGGNKYHIFHQGQKVGKVRWENGISYTDWDKGHEHHEPHEQKVEEFTGDLPRHN